MNLAIRCQGLMFASNNPKRIRSIEDVGREDVTFVNRQKGSGTRILLDAQLRRIGIPSTAVRGYEHEEATHTAVASLIAEGKADLALGVESAATVAGLGFIPMVKERYDLVSLKEVFDQLPMWRIREVVCSDSYIGMMRRVTGYDVSNTGKLVIVGP
jgi:putative molybdopterin biosynthesis protein